MSEPPAHHPALPALLVNLFKGVQYKEDDPTQWQDVLDLHVEIRDYTALLGLELILDESEGYAYLRQQHSDDSESKNPLPRLIPLRQLSFPVSLLLALLRKRLAEFDANGGDSRLILSREQMLDMLRLFLPRVSNEARLIDRLDSHIAKVVELGFVRKLRNQQESLYEVRRIIKAFVDAQWLNEFDQRLAEYATQVEGDEPS